MHYAETLAAHPPTQIRLLARDEVLVIAADLFERFLAHQSVSAAMQRLLALAHNPVEVEDTIK
jgi:hypothetical protein